jgi:phospholipid/cholesterol/gamma-HCH transport system substrate-binding protein
MRSVSGVGRIAAIGAVVIAVAVVAYLLLGQSYTVVAEFENAGQLVKGNPVQTGGVPIGSVKDIRITEDGLAEADLEIEDEHAPLRRGTRATIRQFSLSGIANRFVDLTFPPAGRATIPDGGRIDYGGRPRRAVQHARPSHPRRPPEVLQGLRRDAPGPGG